MKVVAYTIALILSIDASAAFLNKSKLTSTKTTRSISSPSIALHAAVELEPEPEGGEELTAIKTMPGSRMKNMGEVQGVTNDEGTVYDFWMTASVEGAMIKEINTKVLKDASKKADFPGFRKGQIPPYAMPQIRGFAVQDGILKTIEAAAGAYGLKSIPGSDGEVTVLEDIPELSKQYKMGDPVEFTAKFNAIYDPELLPAEEETSSLAEEEATIDVEAEAA